MTSTSTQSDTRQARSRMGIWLGGSVVSIIACIALALYSPAAFWAGYLIAAIFWMSVSVGSQAIMMIYGTSGGRWGRAISRSLNAGISTTLVSLIAFWLLALGAATIFPWAGATGHHAALNDNQKIWLAPATVAIKFAIISAIWLFFGWWLNHRHRLEADNPEIRLPQEPAALALIVFFITYSIVAVDFMMSLSPGWASSMYPLIRVLNCSVAAMSIAVIAHNARLVAPSNEQIDRVHDLGNLLQAFNLMWTYLAFDQYILIWTGDIANEVSWYTERHTLLWSSVSIALFALHFVLPFLLLLSRDIKRHPRTLSAVAGLLAVMCVFDLAWTLLPSIPVSAGPALLATLVSLIAIGGIWLAVFDWSFARTPDIPVGAGHDAGAAHSITEAMDHPAGEST